MKKLERLERLFNICRRLIPTCALHAVFDSRWLVGRGNRLQKRRQAFLGIRRVQREESEKMREQEVEETFNLCESRTSGM